MGMGILEPRERHHVPGTITLDEAAPGLEAVQQHNLKHGHGKNSHIVLVPQPSNDPNDPLNWSILKKAIVFGTIIFGTAMITVIPAPILNPGVAEVAEDLHKTIADIARLSGYFTLTVGITSPFASAFARKYGKRPVFVASSILGLVGCLVAEFAKDFPTLVGGRLLQGIGGSAYESLCASVITDLYFVHERGVYVAAIIFLLGSLSNGVSILAGLITTNLGWPYNFHILLPFVALQTILVILFVPETTYVRSAKLNIDRTASISDSDEKGDQQCHVEAVPDAKGHATGTLARAESESANATYPKPKTFWQELALYNGTFTHKSLISMILASFGILTNVVATYNILVSGLIMAWFVAMSVLAGVVFAEAPWLYTGTKIGFLSAGPLIGGTIATSAMALVSDPLIKFLTHRNHGVYEPEFRLVLMLLGGSCTVAGLFAFGNAIEANISIYGIVVIWGLTLFGMSIVGTTTTNYALDAQPAHSVEIFIMNITFKNCFFYGLTNYIVDWYLEDGVAQVFNVIGGISVFTVLTTVPMYVYGKRYRLFWSKHNLLVKFGLDEKPEAGGGHAR